jgi:hypothetical protein
LVTIIFDFDPENSLVSFSKYQTLGNTEFTQRKTIQTKRRK